MPLPRHGRGGLSQARLRYEAMLQACRRRCARTRQGNTSNKNNRLVCTSAGPAEQHVRALEQVRGIRRQRRIAELRCKHATECLAERGVEKEAATPVATMVLRNRQPRPFGAFAHIASLALNATNAPDNSVNSLHWKWRLKIVPAAAPEWPSTPCREIIKAAASPSKAAIRLFHTMSSLAESLRLIAKKRAVP